MDKIYDDAMNFGKEPFIRVEPIPHGYGKRDEKLTVRHERQDIFYEVSSGLCHPFRTA
jgi:hypothetical protein